MKFGKRLQYQIQETLPEWRNKYLCYKDLKKLVRLVSSAPPMALGVRVEDAEAEFVYLVDNEIDKFNSFFMEKEEDFIIRHRELQQRIQRVCAMSGEESRHLENDYKDEMGWIRKDIIDFHGEMVLLENYSNINYTGLAKILKKYDKRTGAVLRLPFIQKVLQQPFFTTDLVSKLIKECEATIDSMFPTVKEKAKKEVTVHASIGTTDGKSIFRNTVAALATMQEMRRGSSTYSLFSLPPLNIPEPDLIQSRQCDSLIRIP